MPLWNAWNAHLAGSYLETSPYAPTTPASILKHPLSCSETSAFLGSLLQQSVGCLGAGRGWHEATLQPAESHRKCPTRDHLHTEWVDRRDQRVQWGWGTLWRWVG